LFVLLQASQLAVLPATLQDSSSTFWHDAAAVLKNVLKSTSSCRVVLASYRHLVRWPNSHDFDDGNNAGAV
jgi:hypothetical protein